MLYIKIKFQKLMIEMKSGTMKKIAKTLKSVDDSVPIGVIISSKDLREVN